MSFEHAEIPTGFRPVERLKRFGSDCLGVVRRVLAPRGSVSDPAWVIRNHDWPSAPLTGDQLTVAELEAVPGQFDDYYESAVDSLARTEVGPRSQG